MSKTKPQTESQEPKTSSTSHKPVHRIRLGRIQCAIWLNETESGKRHNVTIARSFKDGEQWRSSDNFGAQDIPLVIKALDMAHTWIYQSQQSSE